MASLDLELVRHALDTAQQYGFREVEISLAEDQFSAKLSTRPRPQIVESGQGPVETVDEAKPETVAIVSPLVGYYREGQAPLQVGDPVLRGDIVAVIVALGLANDVESKVSGEVTEVFVEPGQAVEYGQVLATVKPS